MKMRKAGSQARLKVSEDRGIRAVEFHRLNTEGPNKLLARRANSHTTVIPFSNRSTPLLLCVSAFAPLRLCVFAFLVARGALRPDRPAMSGLFGPFFRPSWRF